MSYYAHFRTNLTFSDIDKVKSLISEYSNMVDNIYDNTLDMHGYEKYDEDEWYKFANTIAPYVVDNSIIEFEGEDDFRWGFYFKDSKFYEYNPILITPADVGGMKEFARMYDRVSGMVGQKKIVD